MGTKNREREPSRTPQKNKQKQTERGAQGKSKTRRQVRNNNQPTTAKGDTSVENTKSNLQPTKSKSKPRHSRSEPQVHESIDQQHMRQIVEDNQDRKTYQNHRNQGKLNE